MNHSIIKRNNVHIVGDGPKQLLFAPGFGCDQTVWQELVDYFKKDYQVILFDYVGLGDSDIQAFDKEKYSHLSGYAQDVLDVCEALNLKDVTFIGHSVGGMIGLLASLKEADYFSELIMIGPSSCYENDPPAYMGGFERQDLIGLIDMMEKNYIGWANMFASTVMNNPDKPAVTGELEKRFCSTDPIVARTFAEAAFFADNRADLKHVTVPCFIMQCANDIIAPNEVGQYMHSQLPSSNFVQMEATGHCPHMSHPEETIQLITDYLTTHNVY